MKTHSSPQPNSTSELPSASVVIITAERPKEVRNCLASFHRELLPNCDVIVVDASRGSETEKIAAEFAGVKYLRSPIQNLCAQRNLGMRASQKDVVVYLDDDAVAESS